MGENLIVALTVIGLLVVVVPVVVFYSVKLGTYAYYRARRLVREEEDGRQEE